MMKVMVNGALGHTCHMDWVIDVRNGKFPNRLDMLIVLGRLSLV